MKLLESFELLRSKLPHDYEDECNGFIEDLKSVHESAARADELQNENALLRSTIGKLVRNNTDPLMQQSSQQTGRWPKKATTGGYKCNQSEPKQCLSSLGHLVQRNPGLEHVILFQNHEYRKLQQAYRSLLEKLRESYAIIRCLKSTSDHTFTDVECRRPYGDSSEDLPEVYPLGPVESSSRINTVKRKPSNAGLSQEWPQKGYEWERETISVADSQQHILSHEGDEAKDKRAATSFEQTTSVKRRRIFEEEAFREATQNVIDHLGGFQYQNSQESPRSPPINPIITHGHAVLEERAAQRQSARHLQQESASEYAKSANARANTSFPSEAVVSCFPRPTTFEESPDFEIIDTPIPIFSRQELKPSQVLQYNEEGKKNMLDVVAGRMEGAQKLGLDYAGPRSSWTQETIDRSKCCLGQSSNRPNLATESSRQLMPIHGLSSSEAEEGNQMNNASVVDFEKEAPSNLGAGSTSGKLTAEECYQSITNRIASDNLAPLVQPMHEDVRHRIGRKKAEAMAPTHCKREWQQLKEPNNGGRNSDERPPARINQAVLHPGPRRGLGEATRRHGPPLNRAASPPGYWRTDMPSSQERFIGEER